MQCLNCGRENKQGAKFCEACGKPMQEDLKAAVIIEDSNSKSGEQVQEEVSKEKGNKFKFLFLGLGLVFLVGVLIFFHMENNSPEKLYQAKKYQEILDLSQKGKLKDEDKIYLANSYANMGKKDKAMETYKEIFKDGSANFEDEVFFEGYKNYLSYGYETGLFKLDYLLGQDFSATGRQKEIQDLLNTFVDKKNQELVEQAKNINMTVAGDGKEKQVQGGYFVDGDNFYVSLEELQNSYNLNSHWNNNELSITNYFDKKLVFTNGKANNADISVRVLGDVNYLPMKAVFDYFGMELNIDQVNNAISWAPSKIKIIVNGKNLDLTPIVKNGSLMVPGFAIAKNSNFTSYDPYYEEEGTDYGFGQITEDGNGKTIYLINEVGYYPDYNFFQNLHEPANPVLKPNPKPVVTKNEIYMDIDSLNNILCLYSELDKENGVLTFTYSPKREYLGNFKQLPMDFASQWWSGEYTEEYYRWIKKWLGS